MTLHRRIATDNDEALALLMHARDEVLDDLHNAQGRLDEIESAMMMTMQELGAEERTVGDRKVIHKRKIEWIKANLQPLLEEVEYKLLIDSGAYIPEHQETVAATFNMTRTKPLARYSADAKRIIDGAQTDGPYTLKIVKA
jgi:cob(I)alamin adenosyltransferase